MSRIGKIPVELPPQVTIVTQGNIVEVQGPKGKLRIPFDTRFKVEVGDTQVMITPVSQATFPKNMYGLMRSLVYNAVTGVAKGWQKTVELVGVGYRATGGGNEVTLTVGFSHPVTITAPVDTTFAIIDGTKITVSGIDKKVVGDLAARLKATKPPEPYKGKGIRYSGEVVRKKAGKAVKAVGAAQ